NVLSVPEVKWGTKTPFASMRRIVQTDRRFFKIKPGLWALTSHKKDVLEQFKTQSVNAKKEEEFNHSYYQGLLVELGNLSDYDTFVPHQDKNRSFLNRKLSEITSLKEYHAFTYDELVQFSKTIDVTWFNKRKLPNAFFEVEHSTDIYNSFRKFVEFQDFRVQCWIVADEARKQEFTRKLEARAFEDIKETVRFLSYEALARWHSNLAEQKAIQAVIGKAK
ncbi:MAG: hypothetical protein ACRDBG_26285, partial [Waterburya sp.]